MKRIIPLIFLALIIAACTTMPPEINDKYLAEKTDAESKNIFAMENKIIETNREKQTLEKKIYDNAKLPEETEKELNLLQDENDVLKKQIAVYEKNKDEANLEAKKKQLNENEIQIKAKSALLKYQQMQNDYNDTELDLKNAELAKYIAELNVEKSRIAAVYRDKHEEVQEEEEGFFSKLFNKKDPDDKYEYKQYGEYLDKTEQDKSKAETKFKEAEKNFLEAKKALEKFKK